MAEEKARETVWVQAWSAQVPGSVAVQRSVLAQVAGLENLPALVPMMVQVKEKEWQLVPAHLVRDSVLVQESDLEMESVQGSETAKAPELPLVQEKAQELGLEPWKD